MSTAPWPQSPPAETEQRELPLPPTWAARYAAWRATEDGRKVYTFVRDQAIQRLHAGERRIGVKALVEMARGLFHLHVNNGFTSHLARELVDDVQDLEPLIERRKTRAA